MSRLLIPGDGIAGSLVRPDRALVPFLCCQQIGGEGVASTLLIWLVGTGSLNRVLSNSY